MKKAKTDKMYFVIIVTFIIIVFVNCNIKTPVTQKTEECFINRITTFPLSEDKDLLKLWGYEICGFSLVYYHCMSNHTIEETKNRAIEIENNPKKFHEIRASVGYIISNHTIDEFNSRIKEILNTKDPDLLIGYPISNYDIVDYIDRVHEANNSQKFKDLAAELTEWMMSISSIKEEDKIQLPAKELVKISTLYAISEHTLLEFITRLNEAKPLYAEFNKIYSTDMPFGLLYSLFYAASNHNICTQGEINENIKNITNEVNQMIKKNEELSKEYEIKGKLDHENIKNCTGNWKNVSAGYPQLIGIEIVNENIFNFQIDDKPMGSGSYNNGIISGYGFEMQLQDNYTLIYKDERGEEIYKKQTQIGEED